jgi:aminopeptidase
MSFQDNLSKLADVAIKVGLNLQRQQQLIVWASPEIAPVVHEMVRAAYRAGATFVKVDWEDEAVTRIRFEEAPEDSFHHIQQSRYDEAHAHLKDGHALLNLKAPNPSLMDGIDPERVSINQRAKAQAMRPIRELGDVYNWLIMAAPTNDWACKVFPTLPVDEAVERLWDVVFELCRVSNDEPVNSWKQHQAELKERAAYLTDKAYHALHYTAPGTDLTVGLGDQHVWLGGGATTRDGIDFLPNIPTEEVFTMPHRDRVDGVVTATRPLLYGGALIDSFSLTFKDGKVVDLMAETGEKVLRNLIESDEGAARLGEAALLPHSSPISQSELVFYNTLYDENASCHLALGLAYRASTQDGDNLLPEEFAARGGNTSMVHVDFMIGSDKLNIDGITQNGSREPVMRAGEWAF